MSTAHTNVRSFVRVAPRFVRVGIALVCVLLVTLFASVQVAHGHALSHAADLSCPLCAMAHQPAGFAAAALTLGAMLLAGFVPIAAQETHPLRLARRRVSIRPPPANAA